jgi:trk system potassium uptake protein TrkH
MHKTAVAYAVGKMMQLVGLCLVIPLAIGLYDLRAESLGSMLGAPDATGFIAAIIIAILVGTALVVRYRSGKDLQGIKEGYAIVTFGWLALTFVGAVPFTIYFISGQSFGFGSLLGAFTNSYFEIMSGFTTTGATILTNIEAVPRSLLFLRALTHWLGGMGIITLAIAIFPAMGVSGYQMFRGEVPGPTTERLQPRLAQTASVLWGVYFLFSLAETILLMIGGMNLFDAVCHTFATMATGGFSTKNASIAAFHSDFIEWVIVVFMYLAGVNFMVHFRVLRGELKNPFKNREFAFYTGVVVVAVVIVTGILYFKGMETIDRASEHFRAREITWAEFDEHYYHQQEQVKGLYNSFKAASFQTVSIVTTTGFVTADFDIWPDIIRFILVLLMFFGGCAGSTGGGLKMTRIVMIAKIAVNEVRKLAQPRLVSPVRVEDKAINDKLVINVASFALLYIGLFVLTAGVMTLFVPDLTTAVTASSATIGNIGPGLAGVGAVEHYAWIPIPGKWVLILSMLLGRLEIFTVLIVLRPAVWRK